jgi:beta-phosphoglucomutase-like phosphatase (HAD superfamily)
MKEAMDAGLKIGVCTTSNEQTAKAITEDFLPDIKFDVVLAGDVVSRKKPDPEIYNLALTLTGLKPEEAVVIEDSRNGVLAAKSAGIHVVVTTNYYTEQEDLSGGDIIVSCLGDPAGEKGKLLKGALEYDGVLRIEQLEKYFSK